MTVLIPIIDVGPARDGDIRAARAVAADIGQALETVGFFQIVGHGVDQALVQAMRDRAYEFFALPIDQKMKVGRPAPGISRGYDPPAQSSLSATKDEVSLPDLQEAFAFGGFDFPPDDPFYATGLGHYFFSPNLWPETPSAMRSTMEAYHTTLNALAARLMQLFALALDLDEHFFDDKIDRTGAHVRLNKYPAQPNPPEPGQLRCGAHTDYGTLTILYGEDTPGGLQALDPNGAWIDVHPEPGAFVVNIGDSMAQWTNDRWVSTVHRVVNPPREHAGAERLSTAFFHSANYDTEIACLDSCRGAGEPEKYEPVFYASYFIEKIMKSRKVAASEAASA